MGFNQAGSDWQLLIVDELDFGDLNVISTLKIKRRLFVLQRQDWQGISQNQVNKQFDAVPLRAESQSVSSNRLMWEL